MLLQLCYGISYNHSLFQEGQFANAHSQEPQRRCQRGHGGAGPHRERGRFRSRQPETAQQRCPKPNHFTGLAFIR